MGNTASEVPAKWDAAQLASQKGKTIIITGANSGIGFETAHELIRHGANVVLACRNESRGLAAKQKLDELVKDTPNAGSAEFMQLDVSSLASVKAFATNYRKSHDRLDVLVNNAGIMAVPYAQTIDGLESQFATNHLGHFALTAQLFDLLEKSAPARIVNVSSLAHRHAKKFNETEIMATKDKYNPVIAYADSKQANILFTKELARKLEANGITGVTTAVCHPGYTETNLYVAPKTTNEGFWKVAWKIAHAMPIYQSAAMGALPTLYAACAPSVKNGQYFGPGGFNSLWGHPALEEPTKQAQSESAALKVWELSEQLTGATFPFAKK